MASGNAGAIRAGKAVVEIGADNTPLQSSLAKAKAMVLALGNTMKGLGKFSLISGGLAGTGLIAGYKTLKDLQGDFVDKAKDIKTISTVLGVSAEEASKLAFAFESAGMNADELLHVGTKLQKEIADAAQKGGGVFAELGLDARKLAAEPVDQAMSEIAKSVMGIQNATVRNFAGEEVFGKRWSEVAKLVVKDLDKVKQEAEDLGLVMDQAMIDRAMEVSKSMKTMGFIFQAVLHEIGSALLPAKGSLKGMVEFVKDGSAAVRRFVGENQGLVGVLAKIGLATAATTAGLFTLGKIAGFLGGALSVAIVPFKLALTAVGTLVSAIPLLISPIGLAGAAIAGLGAIWLTQTDSGKAFAKELGGLFGDLGDTASTTWKGIVNAVKAGDLELAGKIAFKGLELAWAQLTTALGRYWRSFKSLFSSVLDQMRTDLAKFITFNLSDKFWDDLASVKEALGMDARQERATAEMMRTNPGAIRNQLDQMHRERQVANPGSDDARERRLRSEIDALKGELSGLSGQAAEKMTGMEKRIKEESDKAKEAAANATRTTAIKGGFDLSRAQQQFGFADDLKESMIAQTKAQEKAAAELKQIKDALLKFTQGIRFA
jgi:hypothetical protein